MSEGPKRSRGIADELRPHVDKAEAQAINAVAERLIEERPVPRAGFRAELHARLVELGQRRLRSRPRNLRVLVAAYAGSGTACLAIAAIGLTGAGPLSP